MFSCFPKLRDDLFIHSEFNRVLYLYPEAPDWITINNMYKNIFDKFDGNTSLDEINGLIRNNYTDESELLISQIKELINTSSLFCHNINSNLKEVTTEKPKYVYLTLTDRCNLNCIYCYTKDRNLRDDATYTDWCHYIDEVYSLSGECTFTFTGGEPLLVPYIFDLAKYIKGKGCSSILLTNGTKITTLEVAHEIANLFDQVRISLDSIDENINAQLRGENTLNSVKKAVKLLHESDTNYIIMATVNKLNENYIDEFTEYFDNHVYFQPFYKIGSGRNHNEIAISGLDYYNALTKTSKFKYLHDYHNTIHNYRNNPYKRCAMAIEEISIASNGDLFPCHMLHYDELKIGNLKESKFKDLYSKIELKELRKMNVDVIPQCSNCIYKYFCGGACRARVDYKKNGLAGEDDFCVFEKKQILDALMFSFG